MMVGSASPLCFTLYLLSDGMNVDDEGGVHGPGSEVVVWNQQSLRSLKKQQPQAAVSLNPSFLVCNLLLCDTYLP